MKMTFLQARTQDLLWGVRESGEGAISRVL